MKRNNELFDEHMDNIASIDAYNEGITGLYKVISVIGFKENAADSSFYDTYKEATWYFKALNREFDNKYPSLIEINKTLNKKLIELDSIIKLEDNIKFNRKNIQIAIGEIEKNVLKIEKRISDHDDKLINEINNSYIVNLMVIIQICIFGCLIFIALIIITNLKRKV